MGNSDNLKTGTFPNLYRLSEFRCTERWKGNPQSRKFYLLLAWTTPTKVTAGSMAAKALRRRAAQEAPVTATTATTPSSSLLTRTGQEKKRILPRLQTSRKSARRREAGAGAGLFGSIADGGSAFTAVVMKTDGSLLGWMSKGWLCGDKRGEKNGGCRTVNNRLHWLNDRVIKNFEQNNGTKVSRYFPSV